MTASTGTYASTKAKVNNTPNEDVWEIITTFTLISGDTTGAAAIPLNGIIRDVVVTLTDMEGAEGTTDVSLTDNGDNTIFTLTDLAESATYVYAVDLSISEEVNIVLGFTDPAAAATVTVTLRGI